MILERLKPAPELRPYLVYSVGLHAALAAAALGALPWGGRAKQAAVYTIDFVGGPTTVATSAGGPAPKAAELAPPLAADRSPQREVDEFGRRRKKGPFVLPRPSLLKGIARQKEERTEKRFADSATADTGALGADAAGGSSAILEMPNFPYPWYITQVRQALWNLWSARMPRARGETVVVFSILKNGSVVDLRTEVSSGDGAFDLAALGAAQDAAPFPPLPRGFSEPFLKIHVTLKSGG